MRQCIPITCASIYKELLWNVLFVWLREKSFCDQPFGSFLFGCCLRELPGYRCFLSKNKCYFYGQRSVTNCFSLVIWIWHAVCRNIIQVTYDTLVIKKVYLYSLEKSCCVLLISLWFYLSAGLYIGERCFAGGVWLVIWVWLTVISHHERVFYGQISEDNNKLKLRHWSSFNVFLAWWGQDENACCTFQGLKSGLAALRMFSVTRSTKGAFVVHFRVMNWKTLTSDNNYHALELTPLRGHHHHYQSLLSPVDRGKIV